MRTLVVNAPARPCCGHPRGRCRCYDDPPAANAAELGDPLPDDSADVTDAVGNRVAVPNPRCCSHLDAMCPKCVRLLASRMVATNADDDFDALDDEGDDSDYEPDDLTDNAADDVLEVPTINWSDAEPLTNAADYADDLLGVPDVLEIAANERRREAAERRDRLSRRGHRAAGDDLAANADPDILCVPQIDWGPAGPPADRLTW